jgi:hypothetical protein
MTPEQTQNLKEGTPVYYSNPDGDTIPTEVRRISYTRTKVQLYEIKLDQKYPYGHRKGWVPITRVELQVSAL